MTREEKELMEQIVRDHPNHQFYDGKRSPTSVISARDLLTILGKELPEDERTISVLFGED